MLKLFCLTSLIFYSISSFAIQFKPVVSTDVPLFMGAGFDTEFNENWGLELEYGLAPQVYVDAIGSVVSSSSGNSSYDDVIDAAFKNNQIWKAGIYYRFQPNEGWKANLNYYGVTSKGDAEIDTVLAAATGKDYSTLKTLLIAAGKDTSVDMKSELQVLEATGTYVWNMGGWDLEGTLGIAKIIGQNIHIKTGLPNFEASANGQALLRSSESEMEQIMSDYGVTPVVGLQASFKF